MLLLSNVVLQRFYFAPLMIKLFAGMTLMSIVVAGRIPAVPIIGYWVLIQIVNELS